MLQRWQSSCCSRSPRQSDRACASGSWRSCDTGWRGGPASAAEEVEVTAMMEMMMAKMAMMAMAGAARLDMRSFRSLSNQSVLKYI